MKDDTLKRRSMRDENTQNNKHLGIINQWYLGSHLKPIAIALIYIFLDIVLLALKFAALWE